MKYDALIGISEPHTATSHGDFICVKSLTNVTINICENIMSVIIDITDIMFWLLWNSVNSIMACSQSIVVIMDCNLNLNTAAHTNQNPMVPYPWIFTRVLRVSLCKVPLPVMGWRTFAVYLLGYWEWVYYSHQQMGLSDPPERYWVETKTSSPE